MTAAQYSAAFSANLGAMAGGTVVGFSSPVGPLLDGRGHNLHLTDSQFSWFSSSMTLGAMIGGLLGGILMNFFGRRGTLIFQLLPFTLGWGLIAGAQNFAMLMVGRILTGICVGIACVVIPTYNGEYPSSHRRGMLASGFQVMAVIGVLFAYMVGAGLDSFRYIAIICGSVAVVSSGLMIFQKESPTHLLAKGKEDEAKVALQYFRGKNFNITEEFENMKRALKESKRKKVSFNDLRKPYIAKPLAIGLLLMIFQQICGVNAVIFNLRTIFISSGSTMSDTISSVIIGVLQVVGSVVGLLLIDKLGRRILLITSAVMMCLSLIALGVFFYLKKHAGSPQNVIDSFGWLPIFTISIFILAFSVGYGPIPWVMMGELFSPEVREITSGLCTCINWTAGFMVTLLFQPMQNGIHDYGAYWLFAGFCLINAVFCIIFVPETKGKTIDEITEMFGKPLASQASQAGEEIEYHKLVQTNKL